MSIQKQIIEKFNGVVRLIIVFFSIPMVALLGIAFLSGKVVGIAVILGVWILLYAVTKLFQRMARQEKPGAWFLVEDGFKYIRSSEEEEMIPWSQIKSMFYVSYIGLFIKCDKIGSQGNEKVVYENVNMILSVDKDEAKELYQSWRGASARHVDKASTQHVGKVKRLRRAPTRSDQKNAGRSIIVGFLALPLVVMEAVSKHWLLAILWGLASAAGFALGLGIGNAKFIGKRGSLIENLLILLVTILFFCLLIAGNRK